MLFCCSFKEVETVESTLQQGMLIDHWGKNETGNKMENRVAA
jgi:hypothetical protein